MGQRHGIQADVPSSAGTVVTDESFPRVLDLIAIAVPVAIGAGTVAMAPSGTRASVAAVIALAVAPWIMRQFVARWSLVWPLTTVAAVAVLHLLGGGEGWIVDEAVSELSMLLLVWVVVDDAVSRDRVGSRITFGAALILLLARGIRYSGEFHNAYLGSTSIWLGGLLLAHLGGRLLHHFALNVAELRSAQARLAGEAVAAEQRRIAREVHDVVAHTLSVTALHLSAARMALDRGDVDEGSAALADAEQLNRSSLTDLRRTVRLLRPPADGDAAPDTGIGTGTGQGVDLALPGIEALAALVQSSRAVAGAVELTVDPSAHGIDDLRSLTAYRIVQESLTNALRHQERPRIAVTVAVDDTTVRIAVSSSGAVRPQAGAGMGLMGMRERVEGLGGTLAAGPSTDGWLVSATLPAPRPEPARAPSPAPEPVPSSCPTRVRRAAPADVVARADTSGPGQGPVPGPASS